MHIVIIKSYKFSVISNILLYVIMGPFYVTVVCKVLLCINTRIVTSIYTQATYFLITGGHIELRAKMKLRFLVRGWNCRYENFKVIQTEINLNHWKNYFYQIELKLPYTYLFWAIVIFVIFMHSLNYISYYS